MLNILKSKCKWNQINLSLVRVATVMWKNNKDAGEEESLRTVGEYAK
jgi:hypothetical protein